MATERTLAQTANQLKALGAQLTASVYGDVDRNVLDLFNGLRSYGGFGITVDQQPAAAVSDGTSNTIMFSEVVHRSVGWTEFMTVDGTKLRRPKWPDLALERGFLNAQYSDTFVIVRNGSQAMRHRAYFISSDTSQAVLIGLLLPAVQKARE
jgi:hypothetical protein